MVGTVNTIVTQRLLTEQFMPGLARTTWTPAEKSKDGNLTAVGMAAGASLLQHSVCSGGVTTPGCMTWGRMEDHIDSPALHDRAVGSTSFRPVGLFLFPKAVQVVHAPLPYRLLWPLFLLKFCKIEIRHTLGRKNLLSDFSFSNSKSLLSNY